MPSALVSQLYFAREEFQRLMEDVTPGEGERTMPPFNSLSFIVAHLAVHEHSVWLVVAQDRRLYPELGRRYGPGADAAVPAWQEAWDIWQAVTQEANHYLETLTDESMDTHLIRRGQPMAEALGHMLLRMINHYWFHLGEAHGIRQALGHRGIPDFVGEITRARYR